MGLENLMHDEIRLESRTYEDAFTRGIMTGGEADPSALGGRTTGGIGSQGIKVQVAEVAGACS